VQLKAIALSSWFLLASVRQTIHVHLTVAHLSSLSAVIFSYSGKILGRFVQVRRLVDGSRKYHPLLLTPLLSISRNRSLSLGHLHGNSWCTYTTGRGVRPEARIETTSLPRRTMEGCRRSGGERGQAGALWMRRLPENPFCEYWR